MHPQKWAGVVSGTMACVFFADLLSASLSSFATVVALGAGGTVLARWLTHCAADENRHEVENLICVHLLKQFPAITSQFS
ncbi:hypothetical protein GE09DRAFT_1138830 [Coniochaeta sp. 2T2.1]|nr:hypothetical protein GE09DRAFT_1138830 [Coniochaeta sp. 2T2.1]